MIKKLEEFFGRAVDFVSDHLLAILSVGLVAFMVLVGFAGCYEFVYGNSGVKFKKDVQSNYSSLERDVVVVNSFTGDTLFKYSGPCYFTTEGREYNKGIALIYEQNGKTLKANFAGQNIVFIAVER